MAEETPAEQSARTGIPIEHLMEGAGGGTPVVPEEPVTSATPPGAAPTVPAEPTTPVEPDFDLEFDAGDGSPVQRYSNAQMVERLSNYRKLEAKVGSQANRIAELEKTGQVAQPAPVPAKTDVTVPKPTAIDFGNLTDEDFEDGRTMKTVMEKMAAQNQELAKAVAGLPSLIDQKADEKADQRETRSEMIRVMNNNSNLKQYEDPIVREAIVKMAAAIAVQRNETAGFEMYTDMDTSVNVFFKILKGEKPAMTQQGWVKNLKSVGGEVLPVSTGKPAGDLVKRYAALATSDQKAAFLDTLDDAGREAIDEAVYSGKIEA